MSSDRYNRTYSESDTRGGGGGGGSLPHDPNNKLRETQRKADEVTAVARDNINKSIAQVDRLEDMEQKSEELEAAGRDFHRGAQQVRRKFCFQYYRLTFIIFLIVAILIVILYFSIKSKTD